MGRKLRASEGRLGSTSSESGESGEPTSENPDADPSEQTRSPGTPDVGHPVLGSTELRM
jgi:hypothetical protein